MVIERDSFCFHWWTKTPCAIVDTGEIKDSKLRKIITSFESGGGKVFLLDATTDLEIPVFISISIHTNKQNNPSRVIAASCNLDKDLAIEKSIE